MRKVIIITVMLTMSIASQAQLNNIISSISNKIDDIKSSIAQSLVKVDTVAVTVTDTIAADTVPAKTPEAVPGETVNAQPVVIDGGLPYLRKVYDNAVYAKNIVSKIGLGINGMGKDITLDGRLQMRKGEVIRITVTPFGLMEVARLEFTPTYVLLIDRIHKEFVKASYDDVAFLKSEGLTFYTLQSLFWNELFQPGKARLNDSDLRLYTTSPSSAADGQGETISFTQDKMVFTWQTDKDAHITATEINYGAGTKDASNVKVSYGNFIPVGVKMFPKREYITFNTKAFSTGTMSLNIDMNNISTDSSWEATTNVSSNYKQVTAEEFFTRLSNL